MGHHVFLQPLKLATLNLVHNLVFGTSLPKNNVLDKNRRGSGPGEHPKKWNPLRIFATVEAIAASNMVHKLRLRLAYQKDTRTKIGGGLGQGSIQTKFGTPYVFLQPLKLTSSNMVHKLMGLGLA